MPENGFKSQQNSVQSSISVIKRNKNKRRTKILSMLCFFVLFAFSFLAIFLGVTNYSENNSNILGVSNIVSAEQFGGGSGIEQAPYQIQNFAQLLHFQNVIENNTNDTDGNPYKNKYFAITSDIRVPAKYSVDNGATQIVWSGIADGFSGTLNGNNNIITFENAQQGLFKSVSGTITNLGIAGYISNSSGSLGGIAGSCSSNIKNCFNTATIIGGASANVGGIAGLWYLGTSYVESQCYNSGIIKCGNKSSVGGIAGDLYGFDGRASDFYNLGDIYGGDGCNIGGVFGYISIIDSGGCDVNYAYNSGNVYGGGNSHIGGVIGKCEGASESSANLEDAFNVGNVTGGTGSKVGGISGYLIRGVHISHCYSVGYVSGIGDAIGGILGESDYSYAYTLSTGAISYCATSQNIKLIGNKIDDTTSEPSQSSASISADSFKTREAFVSGTGLPYSWQWGFDNIWAIDANKNNSFPYFKNLPTSIVTVNFNGGKMQDFDNTTYIISMLAGKSVDLSILNVIKNGTPSYGYVVNSDSDGKIKNNFIFTFGTKDCTINASWTPIPTEVPIKFTATFTNDTPKGGIFLYILQESESGTFTELYTHYYEWSANLQFVNFELTMGVTYKVIISKPYVWNFSISGENVDDASFQNNIYTFKPVDETGVINIVSTGGTPPNSFTIV